MASATQLPPTPEWWHPPARLLRLACSNSFLLHSLVGAEKASSEGKAPSQQIPALSRSFPFSLSFPFSPPRRRLRPSPPLAPTPQSPQLQLLGVSPPRSRVDTWAGEEKTGSSCCFLGFVQDGVVGARAFGVGDLEPHCPPRGVVDAMRGSVAPRMLVG